ncbi:hypothetical protein DFJ73DRAFT_92401 [Zopfochytrium polystomum]|nr:hypothetical protein DFJ73DRAFT_92401 [Zopfochytrium polystomum]
MGGSSKASTATATAVVAPAPGGVTKELAERAIAEVLISSFAGFEADDDDDADIGAADETAIDADAADLIAFLAGELLGDLPRCLDSPRSLAAALSTHIQDLAGLDAQDAQYACEQIYDALRPPAPIPEDADDTFDEDDAAANDDGDDSGTAVGPLLRRAPPPPSCELCDREMVLTFHHLIPRAVHRKLRRQFAQAEMDHRGAWLCRPCHSAVHRLFNHERLGRELNTVERLMEEEAVQRWVRYAEKQRYTPRVAGMPTNLAMRNRR